MDAPATYNPDNALTSLTSEFWAWQKQQGLKLDSAGDHVNDPALTPAQRAWIALFVKRWALAEETIALVTLPPNKKYRVTVSRRTIATFEVKVDVEAANPTEAGGIAETAALWPARLNFSSGPQAVDVEELTPV